MILRSLRLQSFRCYLGLSTFSFAPDVTWVVGANAKGKTTILEAVYMLSTGRGFREERERELLTFQKTHGFVQGDFVDRYDGSATQAAISFQMIDDETLLKNYSVNRSPMGLLKFRRMQPPVVLFAPQQIEIVTGSPSHRREYFNSLLSKADMSYGKALREYEAALRRRNAVLEEYTDMSQLKTELWFWDKYLVERARTLHDARERYTHYLNAQPEFGGHFFAVIYHPSLMTQERLREKFPVEAAARRTLIGPQKDDFEFLLATANGEGGMNVHRYGSRSQQRITVLWLKLREIAYLQESMKDDPILLLDDIFSEFDQAHRDVIISLIPRFQTIITSTQEPAGTALSSNTVVVKV
jgi:DNA replication and repair protein RecF